MHALMFAKPGGRCHILHGASSYYYQQLLTLTDLTALAMLSDDELKHLKRKCVTTLTSLTRTFWCD